jgi:hypothetical protein
MAKVSNIRVEVNFTRNLGNFESLKLGASADLVIEDGDDVKKIYKKAYDMCSAEIMEQLTDFENSRKKK